MNPQDLAQIAVGFAVVVVMVCLTIAFPVYAIHGNGNAPLKLVRRPIWDPPTYRMNRQFDNYSDEELKVAKRDHKTRKMIERWQNAEPVAYPRIFLGSKYSRYKNPLGTFTTGIVLTYVFFVAWKIKNRG